MCLFCQSYLLTYEMTGKFKNIISMPKNVFKFSLHLPLITNVGKRYFNTNVIINVTNNLGKNIEGHSHNHSIRFQVA